MSNIYFYICYILLLFYFKLHLQDSVAMEMQVKYNKHAAVYLLQ